MPKAKSGNNATGYNNNNGTNRFDVEKKTSRSVTV